MTLFIGKTSLDTGQMTAQPYWRHLPLQSVSCYCVIWQDRAVCSCMAKRYARRVNDITRTLLSPVMTITRIPARRHSLMASMTSFLGGSNIPTRPTNVQFVYTYKSENTLTVTEKIPKRGAVQNSLDFKHELLALHLQLSTRNWWR